MSESTNQMGLFDTMYNCRAMRRLDTREVPETLLRDLISAANQAPSGSNTQGARWIVVRDPETKQQLADLNRQGVDTYLAPLIDNPGSLSHQSGDKRKRMVDAVVWQRDDCARQWLDLARHTKPAACRTRIRARCRTHHTGANRSGGSRQDSEPARFHGGLRSHTGRLPTRQIWPGLAQALGGDFAF